MEEQKLKTVKDFTVNDAVKILCEASLQKRRDLSMPVIRRYQPPQLSAYLGYDQWAGWLIIVEWFWMKTLAKIGDMPAEDAELLTEDVLRKMLFKITTTSQDEEEKITKHDILALLSLMRKYLPKRLHKWLHFCATSYDIINTAYALQLKVVFEEVFLPELESVDQLWRKKIIESTSIIQAGRTHLQTALPVTPGFWEANLHNRFVQSSRKAQKLVTEIPGCFSGAVGTSASQRVLLKSREGEKVLMEMLGLPAAEVSTQITPPEGMERFYNELLLISGVLANLGEDGRILQSSQFDEITSASSSSSAMSHKTSNPISAENTAGMHVSVIAGFMKVAMTLVSNLQRDLRWSNVMRSHSEIVIYVLRQVLTVKRIFESIKVNEEKCLENFNREKFNVVAELLHLFFQREGMEDAHEFVNKKIVPKARELGLNLYATVEQLVISEKLISVRMWNKLKKSEIVPYLLTPENYLGNAIEIAEKEAKNKL